MKQFKDLTIKGSDEQLVALMEKISANPADGWCRDNSRENNTGVSLFAVARNKEDNPPARLFLYHEQGRLHVTNIVPDCGENGGRLSKSQYNQILDEFAEMVRKVLKSSCDSQIILDITSDNAAITDQISSEAAALLKIFSSSANKSTGSEHLADFERWAEFLVKVHNRELFSWRRFFIKLAS